MTEGRLLMASGNEERLPDLPDIMAAGYGLTDALAWWSRMMNTPGHSASYWWQVLKGEILHSCPATRH